MGEFKFENQGTNTFLVYQLYPEEQLDTFSYGMISNNTIYGIVPTVFVQINHDKYLKFNVSSKISLEQYFTGVVTKQRLLNVFSNIATAVLASEEYMLNPSTFLLDTKNIYVNVSTAEAEIICFPIIGKEQPIDLVKFFKEIVFSTQFDSSENADYVAKIISFLNGSTNFSLVDFKKLIETLMDSSKREEKKQEKVIVPPPAIPTPVIPVPVAHKPAPVVEEIAISLTKPTDKKAKFSLFGKKKEKAPKKPSSKFKVAIPGMDHAPAEPKPVISKPVIPKPVVSKVVEPRPAPPPMPVPILAPAGETTVLNTALAGETTVLSAIAPSQSLKPYLIRLSNQEKILISKSIFKIGKERSFADYCISDNPAISRSHANIVNREESYYIMDMNSKNRTYVNSTMIPSNVETELTHGCIIRLANEEFEFKTR